MYTKAKLYTIIAGPHKILLLTTPVVHLVLSSANLISCAMVGYTYPTMR